MAAASVAAIALLLLASVPARAFYQDANIVITVDKSAYRLGDDVNVTMHVFEAGLPVDAAALVLRLNPARVATRVVNVTHDSLGLYNATFQIGVADVNSSGPASPSTIVLQVSANLTALTDVESTWVTVVPQTRLGFTLTPSSFEASPGSTVTLSLRVTANGMPRDADQVQVGVLVSESSLISRSVPVSVANVSQGNYTATFVVPADIVAPAQAQVTAVANVSNASVLRSLAIVIPGAQPFTIWAYTTAFLPPVAQFTLFVGDAAGGFVKGANVSLNYTYNPSGTGTPGVTKSAAATTDGYGRAAFNLNLDGATQLLFVMYRGNVTLGANRQAFAGDLYTPSPAGALFEIDRTNAYAVFSANTTARLNYSVTALGNPVAGATVYYYAQTDTDFVAAGTASSGADGTFNLTLPMPTSLLRILMTAMWGTSWYSTSDYVVPYRPLIVTSTPVRVGTAVRVTITIPGPGTWFAGASLGPYQPVLASSPWLEVSGFFSPATPYQSGSQVSYNFSLPKFLPKDADYLLAASALPASFLTTGVSSGYGAYAFAELIHITNLVAQVRLNLSTTSPAVGDVVTANASSSYDSDGYIVDYRISWGDGTPIEEGGSPLFSHAFAAPGDYLVSVAVLDDSGAVSITQTFVHVEATFLGLRASVAIPLFIGVAVVAAAVVVAVWWRRRRRPAEAPVPAEPPAAPPSAPEGPHPPGGS